MIRIIKALLFFVFLVTNFQMVRAQEIYLSREVIFNSDDAFLLLGMINDTILLFRENGNEYSIDVHKQDLDFLFTKELFFEKQRINFNSLIKRENDFTIIYSFEDRFRLNVMARKYDVRGNMIDSSRLFEEKDYLDIDQFSYVLSEDKNKIVLFRSSNYDQLEFILFDLEKHERAWYKKMKFSDYNSSGDLKGLLLSNNGELVLAYEKNNYSYRRKKHFQHMFVIGPDGNNVKDYKIPFKGNLSVSFNFVSDEKNGEIVFAGLYAPKSNSKATGYYFYKFNENTITQAIEFFPFSQQLFLNYSGKQRNPKKNIPDLELKDIIMRNDGGMVLLAEMQKKVLRESVRRRYVDYHYEDIILLSVHPEGDLFWDELIRKYQLSYDDKALFSSYFLFRNPSSMRIIFNDEIKSENTISEYIFNPLGNGKRSSLFSTDLHKLKLVFGDAIQISPDTFIVPSMFSSKFRIIMIRY